MNGLREKTAFAKGALSDMLAALFEKFSLYLVKERGAEFATHRILYFFPFFQEIDTFIGNRKSFPSFEQLLNHFSVAHTRKYLSAMHFFEAEGLIERNPQVQEIYANLDMIERYLGTFKEDDPFYHVIQDYYRFLEEKQMRGKITIRTVRLSLTPAIKFLQYCRLFEDEEPKQTILDGYLWCLPGQRNTLSGFISFYNRTYKAALILSTGKDIPITITLKSPKTSRARRKQLFIQMMREIKRDTGDQSAYTKEEILRISIAYLHNIEIPKEGIKISFLPIKQRKGDCFIRLAGREFFLPLEIKNLLGEI